MSFPNIPDIKPKIDIKLEDVINLLLASVALEEISLSKLIDAEACKINHVLHDCTHKEASAQDAIDINNSVDDTIKNIIKLQMLLQFKLDKVQELMPTTTTTSTTTTSTTTTTTTTKTTTSTTSTSTTTKTTTSSTTTRTTTTKDREVCSLVGKGKGIINNCEDPFHCKIAELKSFINNDVKNRTLSYIIHNENDELRLFAANFNIKIMCCCGDTKEIFVSGKGIAETDLKCDPEKKTQVKFVLRVRENESGHQEFIMIITSIMNKELIHNSGIVKIIHNDSRSRLEICC